MLEGFDDLGEPGDTGEIDGPYKDGNGTYKVLANSDYEVSFKMVTGVMKITMTINRDPKTGKDTIAITGQVFYDDKWIDKTGTKDVTITYDSEDDEGVMVWMKGDKEMRDGFWGGADEDGEMTIEFGGGWNHDFKKG